MIGKSAYKVISDSYYLAMTSNDSFLVRGTTFSSNGVSILMPEIRCKKLGYNYQWVDIGIPANTGVAVGVYLNDSTLTFCNYYGAYRLADANPILPLENSYGKLMLAVVPSIGSGLGMLGLRFNINGNERFYIIELTDGQPSGTKVWKPSITISWPFVGEPSTPVPNQGLFYLVDQISSTTDVDYLEQLVNQANTSATKAEQSANDAKNAANSAQRLYVSR